MICIFFSDLDSVCFSFPDYFSIRTCDANKMAAERDAFLSLCANLALYRICS